MSTEVIPRAAWDPLTPPSTELRKDIQNVVFINTHSDPCHDTSQCLAVVKKLRHHQVNVNKLPDLRYNFLIGANGEVYEGLGWNRDPTLPGHIMNLNATSVMIGFIGPYTGSDLPERYAEASARLIWQGVSEKIISKDFTFKNLMNKAYHIQYRLDAMNEYFFQHTAMEFLLMPREKWGAVPSIAALEDMDKPIKHVFHMDVVIERCRHAEQCEKRMQQIQDTEINNVGHRDLRYNFVVGGNGMVYEGRGWFKRAVLPSRFLDIVNHSIVIGYIGKSGKGGVLPKWMEVAANKLLENGVQMGYVDKDYESHKLFTVM